MPAVGNIITGNGTVPAGGTTNQVLSKINATDYNLQWATPAGGGNVSNSGAPTVDQIGIWVTSTTIKGVTALPDVNFPALTGDITTTAGSLATSIAPNSIVTGDILNSNVTYAKIQNVSATSRFLGRITSAAGVIEELTAANAKTILALTYTDIGGSVPAAGSNTYLQYNNSGVLGGCPNITYDGTTTVLDLSATVATRIKIKPNLATATLEGYIQSTAAVPIILASNAYYDGTNWKYNATGAAVVCDFTNTGNALFFTAPSGTGGTTATLSSALSIFNSTGVAVGINTDPGAGNLYTAGSIIAAGGSITSTSASSPLLILNTTHATNQTARMYFQKGGATQWQFATDSGVNGTHDIWIYDTIAAAYRFLINSAGLVSMPGGVSTGTGIITGSGSVPTAGTTGQILKKTTATNYDYSWATPASYQGTAASTTTYTGAFPGVMMGIGGTITPAVGGRIFFGLSGSAFSTTAATAIQITLRYGTGTKPAFNAAVSGTTVGPLQTNYMAVANQAYTVSLFAVVTGLTVGTAYWLDVSANGTTILFQNVTITAHEF